MTSPARLREVTAQIQEAQRKILLPAKQVDVGKWGMPEDSHLLRTPVTFRDDVVALFRDNSCKGDKMPAEKTVNLMQFRPGEVTMWIGYKESYKSTFLNEVAAYWACKGIGVALSSLEMPAPILLQKTVKQALADATPSVSDIELALEVLSEKLTVYDVTGRVPPRHLLAIMRYCALELQVQHFILDNLTMILSASNDRAEETQSFVADCTTIARTTGMHIHLVAHCAKPENGDEGRVPTGYNVRGTGTAPDMVDNLIVCWRNKPKELKIDADKADEDVRRQPDFILVVDKQRHWDYRGSIKYWINRSLLRFMPGGFEECKPFV
jgi:twinkle protein